MRRRPSRMLASAATNAAAGSRDQCRAGSRDQRRAGSRDQCSTGAAADAPQPAAAAPMTPEQMFEGGTNTYNNWIEFGVGGFLTNGNKAQFQQRNQNSGGAFGGIEDFHFQETIAKGTTMTVDGRAIFDKHDYKLNLAVEKEKLGYLRFSASEFRTWYNGDGGFYPPTAAYYPLAGRCAGAGSR